MLRILRLLSVATLIVCTMMQLGQSDTPDLKEVTYPEISLKVQNIVNSEEIVDPLAGSRSFGLNAGFPAPPIDKNRYCGLFPYSCRDVFGGKKLTTEEYLRCPINIPYCQREACSTDDSFNTDPKKCLSTPGCCYDVILNHYRKYFLSDKLMEGAPVCYKGVQNNQYLKHAFKYVRGGNNWDPSISKCVLKLYKDDIDQPIPGCGGLEMMEFFGYQPRIAGWDGIGQADCHLLNKCWIVGRGCFHPVGQSIIVAPGSLPPGIENNPNYRRLVVGKPKCQHFSTDMSQPTTVMDSYHTCLMAGCSVHSSFNDKIYYSLFGKLSERLTPQEQQMFRQKVLTGEIGADNYVEKLMEIKEEIKRNQQIAIILQNLGLFGAPITPLASSFAAGGGVDTSSRSLNAGGPLLFPHPNACPYAYPSLPGGRPHQMGSTASCCKFSMCFSLVNNGNARSGISHYYTRWSQWSTCSNSCGGGGTRTRRRRCVAHEKLSDQVCTLSTSDQSTCNEQPCPAWSSWSNFGDCSRSCGGGTQNRQRKCLPEGSFCSVGSPADSRECRTGPCPTYSDWTQWSPCSSTCGMGIISRQKTCTDPGAYGCEKQVYGQEQECRKYCGSIVWGEYSSCKKPECYKTKTGQCLYKGRPGYCTQTNLKQQEKCYDGINCMCKHGFLDCSGFNFNQLNFISGFGG